MATGDTAQFPVNGHSAPLRWLSRRNDVSTGLLDLEPGVDDFLTDVLAGLHQRRKRLSCKFLYDQRGSELFDQICELREYYPTRTELAIMRQHAAEMADVIGPACTLIEYGSGTSLKTRLLLTALDEPAAYIPVDISRSHLLAACEQLRMEFPRVPVLPVCGDYTKSLRLPHTAPSARRRVVYFPGSTVGNFVPRDAIAFLRRTRRLAGSGSGLLIGVDLKKDPRVLHAAYNDNAGVTAEFNLNLLVRINRELQGTFDLKSFAHYAPYNARLGRIEMHLVSRCHQQASVGSEVFEFERGESIFTECSYKYTLGQFERLAAAAGYRPEIVWTDRDEMFSVQYFVAE